MVPRLEARRTYLQKELPAGRSRIHVHWMNRKTLLTLASCIALGVGTLAAFFPGILLASKGVAPVASTVVWVRECGVALLAIGGIALAVRSHANSPTLRAFLLGNAAYQVMLAPIEVLAFFDGTITELSGIVPNTVIHVVLAGAFVWFGARSAE